MVQRGLERAGRVGPSLKLKTWRMGISVNLSGIGLCRDSTVLGVCVCVCTLSVSALQLISAPTSAYGWVILFVPKCESATVGLTMCSLPLSRLLVSVTGKE